MDKILTICEKFSEKSKNEQSVSRKNEDFSQLLMEISSIGEGILLYMFCRPRYDVTLRVLKICSSRIFGIGLI